MKTQLLSRTFETPLGVVLCELTSNKEVVDFICKNNYENGWSEIYESSGHRIELIEFKSIRNAFVTDSKCWIFRIEKTNSAIETLEIKCTLTDPPNDIIFGEQIYIQYLSAYDNCNDDNVNPWLAVEEYKGTLEKWIGIKLVL
ncbi:MAG: hypothetical protein IT270_14760 [Saprospiraceae bacterium]|nr:hypothetical protein [Saprospiraceae bacterium]